MYYRKYLQLLVLKNHANLDICSVQTGSMLLAAHHFHPAIPCDWQWKLPCNWQWKFKAGQDHYATLNCLLGKCIMIHKHIKP